MKTTIQHNQRDCGAACLRMIAEHYGFSQPITKYRELTKTGKNGVYVYGLVNAANSIGLKGEALSGTFGELTEGIAEKNICFPFIAHIITETNLQHFVVVSDYANGCFTVHDPSKGKIRIAKKDFSEEKGIESNTLKYC